MCCDRKISVIGPDLGCYLRSRKMAPLEDSTNWGTQETSKHTSSHASSRLSCQNPLGLDPTSMKGQAPTSRPAGMSLAKPQNLQGSRCREVREGDLSEADVEREQQQ